MKLYLRVVTSKKYHKQDPDKQLIWDQYGGVGHAMWDKKAMTEKEICWEFMKYEAQEYYDAETDIKDLKPEYIHAYMIEIETFVKRALEALIEAGFAKEL